MALFLLENKDFLGFLAIKNLQILVIDNNLWTVNVKYTLIILNLYFMVHSNVWKLEKIWLSGTLIIIRKPKVWRADGHEDPYYGYIPPTLVERGYKYISHCQPFCNENVPSL
jgi:hypothetical protein